MEAVERDLLGRIIHPVLFDAIHLLRTGPQTDNISFNLPPKDLVDVLSFLTDHGIGADQAMEFLESKRDEAITAKRTTFVQTSVVNDISHAARTHIVRAVSFDEILSARYTVLREGIAWITR